jgi:hypothetical protein
MPVDSVYSSFFPTRFSASAMAAASVCGPVAAVGGALVSWCAGMDEREGEDEKEDWWDAKR